MQKYFRISSLISSVVCTLLLGAFAQRVTAQVNVQGQWTTLPYTMPINPVHATLLANGMVLIVAGSGGCPPTLAGCPLGPPYGPSNKSGALLLNPETGQTVQQLSVSWDMFCNGMVLLQDGRVLIDGGTLQYNPFLGAANASIFDPATNTFTDLPPTVHGRWYPTLLTLPDGRVLTFSGLKEAGGGTNQDVEFFTIGSNWSKSYAAPWVPDLYPRLHVLPNGKVFYSGAQTVSRLFDPSTTTWTANVATTNHGGVRTYGTSVLLPLRPENNYDPKIIIMGGGRPTSTNTTEIIDMGASTPIWQYGPSMSQPRVEMNAVILPDGKVLALGGSTYDEDNSSASLNADLYDPASNTFSSAGAYLYPHLYHSVALLLPDATVWSAGGNPYQGYYVPQQEIYRPAYLFNADGTPASRPAITGTPSSVGYNSVFTVQTPDAANVSKVVLVRNGSVTHAFGMDQRMVELSFTAGNGSLSVTSPPNGNIAPPGYYMLFLLNNSGVPSIASFIQVIGPPDFSAKALPSSLNISAGNQGSSTISTTVSGEFNSSISLSASGTPAGTTVTFNPTTIPASGAGTSTMNVAVGQTTPTGTYPLTVAVSGGAIQKNVTVPLAVTAAVVAAPVFSPKPGSYTSAQSVTITDSTSGATIYYTTNGAVPSTSSTLYSGPITVSKTQTLKAIAVASGYSNSAVVSGVFTIAAAIPVFSPKPATYTSAQSITITDSTPGAAIYYTTDGTVPSPSSTLYSGPITVSTTHTIKAMAVATGYSNSAIVSGVFTIAAAIPVFSPKPATYTSAQSITITDSSPGAAIYYTTDGTVPSTSSTLYSGPITVSTTHTIKALAVASGYSNSTVVSGVFTIAVASPVFSPKAGTYTTAQSITITDPTPGATIYYTTDGTLPSTSSTLYSGPILVSTTHTIKAIAVASGFRNSVVLMGVFNIVAATPVFSPKPGTYTTPQSVTITDSTPGAAIHYTTDGTVPTASSTLYSGPITVSTTHTIKALAVATGYSNSGVLIGLFNIAAATPVFSPKPGTYATPQSITITDSTPGAMIYYTTDGTLPTTSSTLYSGPITVSTTQTLKAMAVATGYSNSAVVSGVFSIP